MSGQDNTTPENGVENYPHERNERNEQTTAAHRRPLPKFQLFIVFLIQFAEPVTATVIYPFINQFVRETGVTGGDERKTGYFAGIIVSTLRHSGLYDHFNSFIRNLHFLFQKH